MGPLGTYVETGVQGEMLGAGAFFHCSGGQAEAGEVNFQIFLTPRLESPPPFHHIPLSHGPTFSCEQTIKAIN